MRYLGLAILFLTLCLAGTSAAGKGGGGTGGGTIYFTYQGGTWSMNSDGSGKAALPTGVASFPSHDLHGGHRWFLAVRESTGTYPSGTARREIFAVRDDGVVSLQLTDQADLECDDTAAWVPGDEEISWNARRWDSGAVAEGGIYTATVQFDSQGEVTGLAAEPLSPTIPLDLVTWTDSAHYFTGDLAPDLRSYDWSPDGSEIVYDRFSADELRIADPNGDQLLRSGFGRRPQWSPDGSRIAFNGSGTNGRGGIHTISPSGGGETVIVNSGAKYTVSSATWSPTGSHIIYVYAPQAFPRPLDIYRAGASGGGPTNLTPDIGSAGPVLGWR